MFQNKLSFFILLFLSQNIMAKTFNGFEVDDTEVNKEFNVELLSGKKNGTRLYNGKLSKVFNQNISDVYKAIINFDEKCNNELKDRRKLTDKKKECKYHNNNLIESKVYKEIKLPKLEENETERYLVARRIYNRQSFSHVDLIQIYQFSDKAKHKNMIIKQSMLSDKEVNTYLSPPVEQDSAFQKAYAQFILTEIDATHTTVQYNYTSETDHWLLNKSISVGKVFDSMAKSLDSLFDSINKDLINNEESKKIVTNKKIIKD